MSQVKRYKVRAALAKRERLARVLISVCQTSGHGRHGYMMPAWDGDGPRPKRVAMVESFDVHAAREHALALVRGYADNDHARNMCALGLDLLTALDGQPSECQTATCEGGQRFQWTLGCAFSGAGGLDADVPESYYEPCPDCGGTGHNLRGVLPAVEWSAQVVALGGPARYDTRRGTMEGGQGVDVLRGLEHGQGEVPGA